MTKPALSELVSLAVETGELQRHLFKYRAINSNFDKILLNDQLWFSKPEDFNDPFDCQIIIDSNNSQLELKQFIKKISGTPLSEERVTSLADSMIRQPQEWDRIVNETIQNHINSSGVCCFGGNENSILLWSHYADSHKGVCLKFDVLADSDFFVFPLKVKYQKKFPVFNYLKDSKRIFDTLIKTKSDVWAYEEEVRVLKLMFGSHSFKKTTLVEIIFGCKSDASEINRIKQLAINNGYGHLTFKKAVMMQRQYGLDFTII